jgi:hypothetical protein
MRGYYTIDFIHLTPEGHAMIAAALLPRVMAILESRGAVNERSTLAGPRKKVERRWRGPTPRAI